MKTMVLINMLFISFIYSNASLACAGFGTITLNSNDQKVGVIDTISGEIRMEDNFELLTLAQSVQDSTTVNPLCQSGGAFGTLGCHRFLTKINPAVYTIPDTYKGVKDKLYVKILSLTENKELEFRINEEVNLSSGQPMARSVGCGKNVTAELN